MTPFLQGATFALSIVVAMFFLKFWRSTRDGFFLLFALAFLVDAVVRAALGTYFAQEQQALIYLGRLLAAGLIIVAILRKNRRRR